jgi:hypothetical protein
MVNILQLLTHHRTPHYYYITHLKAMFFPNFISSVFATAVFGVVLAQAQEVTSYLAS